MGGTHALLVTDVVDSTAVVQALGETRAAELWRAHDRLARDLLRSWHGREIDKSDGLLVLFESADGAAAFASAYHAGLEALSTPLKARVGIHVGPLVLRENDPEDVALGAKPLEVDGVAKAIAARVMSIALGGQTLATADAARALTASAGLRIQSHGHWRLKGIAEPIELFEIAESDAPFVTPPDAPKAHRVAHDGAGWLPVAAWPNNLPQESSSFVGRARELDDLRALLERTRLLTLVGMGGLGKSRLLLRAARDAMAEFSDGVWLAELAPLADEASVLHTVCRALGVNDEPGTDLQEAVGQHLQARSLLLLLDNCEHLIEACAHLVDRLLRAAPGLKVMASSREPLRVPGEQIYVVRPLAVPDSRARMTPSLLDAEAARLFVERARAARQDLVFADAAAPLVVDICRRLDGIPLAIELAAARLRAVSLAELARGLDRRMRVLTGGPRTAQARQQTLRATLDWSHDLLDRREQALLRRLAVFVDGWRADAACVVCAGGEVRAEDVPDLLGSLVDKSWLTHEVVDDDTRYRLLETVREYAHEHLAASDELAATSALHQLHFLSLAEEVQKHFVGTDTAAWMSRLQRERENLLAALAWSGGSATAEVELRLATAMRDFAGALGTMRQAYEGTLQVLRRPECQARNRLRSAAAVSAASQAMQMGRRDEALAHADEALGIARELGDPADVAMALMSLANAATMFADYAAARLHWQAALASARETGSERLVAGVLSGLAANMADSGDLEGAVRHYEENVLIWRRIGHRFNEARASAYLGGLHIQARRFDEARGRLCEAIALTREIGGPRHMAAFAVHKVAHWAACTGRAETAVLLYASLAALRGQEGFSPLSLDDDETQSLARCRASLGLPVTRVLEERGTQLRWEALLEATALALDARGGRPQDA